MRLLLLTICLGLGYSGSTFAQNATLLDASARSVALSDAVTATTGSWSSTNPASWSEITSARVAISAGRLFGLSELSPVSAAALLPTTHGTIGIRARSYGFEAYRQTTISGGWAGGFSFGTQRALHAGVRVDYTHIRQQSPYGQAGSFGLSLGFVAPIFTHLDVGAYATNVNLPSVSGNELSRELGLAWLYIISDNARLVGELNKDIQHPLSVRTGLEWLPVDILALRIGSATAPFKFSGGAGFVMDSVQIDIGGVHHHQLGWSPNASVQFSW